MRKKYIKPELKIAIKRKGGYLMAGSQSPWAEGKSYTFEDFDEEESSGPWHNTAWD
ncbi:MAG: hypothetical protein J5867_06260 [Prevotella sp.]|nr:hypothetical protein [Prevotella sp.]